MLDASYTVNKCVIKSRLKSSLLRGGSHQQAVNSRLTDQRPRRHVAECAEESLSNGIEHAASMKTIPQDNQEPCVLEVRKSSGCDIFPFSSLTLLVAAV